MRDIENLLNTRRQINIDDMFSFQEDQYSDIDFEAKRSFLFYGLKDFTSKNLNALVRNNLRLDIEQNITLFESRLKHVRVQIDNVNKSSIRFRISGVIVIEPVEEAVSFDTYLDTNTCEYKLKE